MNASDIKAFPPFLACSESQSVTVQHCGRQDVDLNAGLRIQFSINGDCSHKYQNDQNACWGGTRYLRRTQDREAGRYEGGHDKQEESDSKYTPGNQGDQTHKGTQLKHTEEMRLEKVKINTK